jgi:DHA2 family multidrug resistance protein
VRFSDRVSPEEKSQVFEHVIDVDEADMDAQGHVNNVTYLRYIQDAAVAHWFAVASVEIRTWHLWVVRRRAGLVMSPSGVSSLTAMVFVGVLLGRGIDARWMVAAGLVVMALGQYWMAMMNLQISPWQVVGPRMVLTLGLGLMFAPMSVAAYKYVPPLLRGAAVGLLSLLRTEGGSVGTSMATTIQQRREQFHLARLTDGLGPLNAHVHGYLESAKQLFFQRTGAPARSPLLGLNSLDELRQQQGAALAYFDVFWLGAVLAVALVVLVLLMKRSVADKGEHIAAE